jgi:hypothetical protein
VQYVILVFWIVFLSLAAVYGPRFLNILAFDFSPPPKSPSAVTAQVMDKYFKEQNAVQSFAVLLQTHNQTTNGRFIRDPKCESEVCPCESSICKFERALNASVYNYQDPQYGCLIYQYVSYYTVSSSIQDNIGDKLWAGNDSVALLNIDVKDPDLNIQGVAPVAVGNFIDWLIVTEIPNLIKTTAPDLDVTVTGLAVFIRDMRLGVEHDLGSMDAITLPLALLILMYMLGSVKVMIIPLLNIGTIVLGSFLIMYPIAHYIPVASFGE